MNLGFSEPNLQYFLHKLAIHNRNTKKCCKSVQSYQYWHKDVVLLSLLLTLNRFDTLLWCLHCWLWISKYWLGCCYLCKILLVALYKILLLLLHTIFQGIRSYYFLQTICLLILIPDGDSHHMEVSPLICRAKQWTGFYMIGTSVMKELKFSKIINIFLLYCDSIIMGEIAEVLVFQYSN